MHLHGDPLPSRVESWLQKHHIRVLNVTGPRESKHSGLVHAKVTKLLRLVFGV